MKNYLTILTILLPLFIACKKGELNEPIANFYLYESAQLKLINNNGESEFFLQEGEDLVFEFTLKHPDRPEIADDELTELFRWQIPNGQTNFKITDFHTINAYYQHLCFCDVDQETSISGMVWGRKLSKSTWEVYIDISIETSSRQEELKASGLVSQRSLDNS